LNKEKFAARSGWQEDPYSWQIAYDFYLKHLSENDSHFWTTLNAYVRSLITDDRNRIVYGYNLTLTHDQVEKLLPLRETVETCKTDTRCGQPDWSDDQKKMISQIPAYAYLQTQLDTAYYFRDKRAVINKFCEQIESDYTFHQENFNDMITHRKVNGKHVFNLPLDASDFSDDDRSLLEKSIGSVWNNDMNSVSITWKTSTSVTSFFHFLFTYEPDNRSFVNFPMKEIQLFPFDTTRAVAHEIGHVLGFDDHYYTLWDADKCEYRSQYTDEDIMSNPDTGDATAAEWQTLMDQYGNR
jgi:hypothetical protein